jgi:2,4-dienoyl-CoA reductase-like NADH-dependent reductase (Old Yellow Enzyme family)
MAELMAGWGKNTPTAALMEAYNQWAQGGWGAILTGPCLQSPDSQTTR